MDINININVGEEPEVKINKEPKVKRKTRKLRNGRETVLELPNTTESNDSSNILNMLGM